MLTELAASQAAQVAQAAAHHLPAREARPQTSLLPALIRLKMAPLLVVLPVSLAAAVVVVTASWGLAAPAETVDQMAQPALVTVAAAVAVAAALAVLAAVLAALDRAASSLLRSSYKHETLGFNFW